MACLCVLDFHLIVCESSYHDFKLGIQQAKEFKALNILFKIYPLTKLFCPVPFQQFLTFAFSNREILPLLIPKDVYPQKIFKNRQNEFTFLTFGVTIWEYYL